MGCVCVLLLVCDCCVGFAACGCLRVIACVGFILLLVLGLQLACAL